MLFVIMVAILAILIGLTIFILYLLTLQNTLKAVSPVNRQMEPGMVWLLLVPVFTLIWQFIVARKISASIEREYHSRGLPCKPQPTYNAGLALAILYCVNTLLYWSIPLRGIISIALLTSLIIYWVQVNSYKNKLRQLPPLEHSDSEIFGHINP